MSRPHAQRRRGLASRLAFPLLLALGAMPLMAPTCGEPGEGYKTFARSSLIIPMDVCYQQQSDGTGVSYPPAQCPQATDPGDVIKAYGLVYQLIRNDVAVYWIIKDGKQQVTDVDLTLQYQGGFPALFYDWTPENPPPSSPPTTGTAIDYRGGPFVVDGSDYARASQVLQNYRATFADRTVNGQFVPGVNVHVSNVAFRAYAKRTMAGGWSAGGTIAPKVALLDIGSTSNPSNGYAKNSEPIIRGYLARAGLDFPGAGGVATDTGHGQIYDRLGMADLQPTPAGGSWTTTNLYKYGYQILWVPHWFAPGSCANATSQSACAGSLYSATQRDQALKTVGAFVASGKDLFAECAGVGSFEGVATSTGAWMTEYSDGDPTTHFHATDGLKINKSLASIDYDDGPTGSAASPLLQLGDYRFVPDSGAIQNFKPSPDRNPDSLYTSSSGDDAVKRLVTDLSDPTWDYFTYRPPKLAAPGIRGSTVYLGGHVYSGYSDTLNADGTLRLDNANFAIGGTRLVLNTLFNLGATCTASGVACNTGQPGACAAGTIACDQATGQPVCKPLPSSIAKPEACNGIDDDCDWEVDEDLQTECYEPPPGYVDPEGRGTTQTLNRGVCRTGVKSCMKNPDGSYAMSACVGQVLPSAEVCNALDDDCDTGLAGGGTDEGLVQACYEGPSSSIDPGTGQPRPICQAGTQTCNLGSWSACVGQRLPAPEQCGPDGAAGDEIDQDCNGIADDTCGCSGPPRPCYSGPPSTVDKGVCRAGTQTCGADGKWSACVGEVLPTPEVCGNDLDENCDMAVAACPGCTSPSAAIGGKTACASVPLAQRNIGQCRDGEMTCGDDSTWGSCLGETLPSPIEACDNVDNNCDGVTDEGAVCPSKFTCLRGVCVPEACGVEMPPPEGYTCNPPPSQGGTGDSNGTVVTANCGAGAPCDPGERCRYGACEQACTDLDGDGQSDQCAAGSICAGGGCVAGGCYATGCPSSDATNFPQCVGIECVCTDGGCVPDPCAGVVCPSGTFCRKGDCVQACTFVSCRVGEVCGIDGFCEADPCSGRTCPPGQRCSAGTCGVDPCSSVSCAAGQVCTLDGDGDAVCVNDPCTGIDCPAGVCSRGQCFATSNPTGAGTIDEPPAEGGCGCGSGAGAALPALLALLAAPLVRRRRPAGGSGRGTGVALILVAVALLGSACKEEDEPFDPATCQETCGEQRCVDVASDAAHCGGCGNACRSDESCVERICGGVVAPRLASLSPGSGPRGSVAPVTIQLSGERFAPGATVRAEYGSTTGTFPTTFVDAGRLTAELDLFGADVATWQLRVVNPDHVISNTRPFDVVIPYPSVTGVSPATVTAGSVTPVLLTGANFTATSQCRIRSAAVSEAGLATTVDAEGVHCELAAGLPPGTYDIWVVNEGNRASNVRQLQIVSSAAELLAVSPSSGPENLPVSLTVTGTGFDAASRVLFNGCAGPFNPVATCPSTAPIVGTTFVSPTTLVAALPLPDCGGTTCAHTISVRTGTGATTTAVGFTVQANTYTITSLSPPTAYQGETVVLAFAGTNLPSSGATIEVQPPGGAFGDVLVTAAAPIAGSVTGTLNLAGPPLRPEGSWLARIRFADATYSAAWPFRVLSNQAVLRDIAPDRTTAGSTTTVTLTVANLRTPYNLVDVVFVDPGEVETLLDPNPLPTMATSDLRIPNLSFANRNTGTYAFKVRNNGATDSNALSFTVTPGMPTVSSVCRLASGACAVPANEVQQQSAPVPVRITGTNFAKPDASGNGSMVMVTSSILPGWPTFCPAAGQPSPFVPAPGTVEVKSPTEIVMQLDTLSAVAESPGGTTYYIAVWNPGGAAPPYLQKSNGCAQPAQWFKILP